MGDWMQQGCDQCRQGILSGRGDTPAPVAVSLAAHAFLRRCPACGAWWQLNEREAHVIPEDEARQTFADHFRAGEGGA